MNDLKKEETEEQQILARIEKLETSVSNLRERLQSEERHLNFERAKLGDFRMRIIRERRKRKREAA